MLVRGTGAVLDVVGEVPELPGLEELTPQIPEVHQVHVPQSGAYLDVVDQVPLNRAGDRRVLGSKDCAASASSRVWFIGASLIANVVGNDVASHVCTVPLGTRFFFPVVAAEADSRSSGTRTTLTELQNQVAGPISQARQLSVLIDGQEIVDVSPSGPYRTRSNAFRYHYPADSILCVLRTCDGVRYSLSGGSIPTAIADGVYIMTTEMVAGEHTIRIRGELSGRRIDASYQVTVQLR
jgi:hypothetical protein